MNLGIPAKIFVPAISSPAKVQRIRDYRAELVVTGNRYADALAASEVWAE
jgi:threonine dehydratase